MEIERLGDIFEMQLDRFPKLRIIKMKDDGNAFLFGRMISCHIDSRMSKVSQMRQEFLGQYAFGPPVFQIILKWNRSRIDSIPEIPQYKEDVDARMWILKLPAALFDEVYQRIDQAVFQRWNLLDIKAHVEQGMRISTFSPPVAKKMALCAKGVSPHIRVALQIVVGVKQPIAQQIP